MTALGFLYPGHSAEDDYPRIEQLLAADIRLDLVHTDIGEDAHRVEALRRMGSPEQLATGIGELRLTGAEAVVWACTSGSFVYGWEGAHEQVRSLAQAAGMPASSTSFAFVHAMREIGVRRVAVGATYPDDVAGLFAEFLRAGGADVVAVRGAGIVTAAEVGTWGRRSCSPWRGTPTTPAPRRSSSRTPPCTPPPTSPPWRTPSASRSSPPTRSPSGRGCGSRTAG